MGMNVGGSSGVQSEINVTPLVDVVLVLLIIFIVMVPAMMQGYDVDVPGEATVTPTELKDLPEQVVLGIDRQGCPMVGPAAEGGLPADCFVRLNDEMMRVADLPDKLAERLADREEDKRVVFLSAEDDLNYEGVMRIIDLAKGGVEGLRIGLVVAEPRRS